MARKIKPPEGTVLAMPLEDGRWGACRVIVGADRKRSREEEGGLVLVATSAWVGDALPRASNPRLGVILKLVNDRGRRGLFWMLDSLPESFVPIGQIPSTPGERRLKCNVSCVWEGVAETVKIELEKTRGKLEAFAGRARKKPRGK